MIEDLMEIGGKAIRHAEKLGATEAEIFLCNEKIVSVKYIGGILATRGMFKRVKGISLRLLEPWLKRKGIPIVKSGINAGVSIRAMVDKSIGFSSVSSIQEKDVLNGVEDALKIAKIRPPDPQWISLPDPKKLTGHEGIFDKKIAETDVAKYVSMAARICVSASDFDRKIRQVVSGIDVRVFYDVVVNSRGIEAGSKGTTIAAYSFAKVREKGEEIQGADLSLSRVFVEDLRELGTNASSRAIESLGAKKLEKKIECPVIFENASFSEFLSQIFAHNVSALNVQEDRTVYKEKLNEQIASQQITLVDDGTLSDGFNTTPFDHEGVPRQRIIIVEKGVLKNFIYDNYTAKREEGESTGNALREAFGLPKFAVQPKPGLSNLVLKPGKRNLEDLIKEVGNGVLVKGQLIGVGHSNFITGDFSVTATNAFRVKNGEIVHPVKPCAIGGNFHEMLKSIELIGNDSKCFGKVTCPSVIAAKLTVSG
jgi:PmbA protein